MEATMSLFDYNADAVASLSTNTSTPATPEEKIKASTVDGYNAAVKRAQKGIPEGNDASAWVKKFKGDDRVFITWRVGGNQVEFFPKDEFPDLPKNAARKWLPVSKGISWEKAFSGLRDMVIKGDESAVKGLNAKLMEAATRKPKPPTQKEEIRRAARRAAKQAGELCFKANDRWYWCDHPNGRTKSPKLMTKEEITKMGLS